MEEWLSVRAATQLTEMTICLV